MKGTITQYITLGIMLLVIVLIVSFYPVQHEHADSSQQNHINKISKLTTQYKSGKLRAD